MIRTPIIETVRPPITPIIPAESEGVVPLSPLDVSSLKDWWDASDPSKIVLSHSPTLLAINSSAPGGVSLSQVDYPALRPEYVNGNAIEFDGTEVLTNATYTGLNGVGDYTILLLGYSAGSPSTARTFLSLESGTSYSKPSNVNCGIRFSTPSAMRAFYSSNNTVLTSENYEPGAPRHAGSLQTLVYRRNYSGTPRRFDYFVNGARTASTKIPAVSSTIIFGDKQLNVGAYRHDTALQGVVGQIRQLIIYSRSLNDTEIAGLLAFLDTKR